MKKIVCFADSHGLHKDVDIPDGDILLFAGDMSRLGRERTIKRFNSFLGELPHPHKIVIAGNHDLLFENDPTHAQSLITNAIYLEDSMVEIEGIKIYGSPYTPTFHDWAFMLSQEELKEKWQLVPSDIDILLTHGPPRGYGDKTILGADAGDIELLEIIRKIKPKYNIYGHIHEAYGTFKLGAITLINASVLNEHYQAVNPPIVINY